MIVASLTIDFGFQIDSYRNVTSSVINPFLAINFSYWYSAVAKLEREGRSCSAAKGGGPGAAPGKFFLGHTHYSLWECPFSLKSLENAHCCSKIKYTNGFGKNSYHHKF